MINIIKTNLAVSSMKYSIHHHRYMRQITYDFDLYEIYLNNYKDPIGYLLKYYVPGVIDKSYIDIYIKEGFRNEGYGTKALFYFINEIIECNDICTISNEESKSNFLLKKGFIKDENYIYKNLYIFRKEVKNE